MLTRWLTWLALLAVGGAFYLFYPGYLSYYTLLLLCALPALSVLLILPVRLCCRLELRVDTAQAHRLEDRQLSVALSGPRWSAGQPAKVRLRVKNRLYPTENVRAVLSLRAGTPESFPLPTGHCGWLSVSVERASIPDWLGLFAIPLRLPPPAPVLVLPRELPGARLPDLSPPADVPLRPRPGGGPGEEYELRPYRPGDPTSAIHWKLTAKRPEADAPILRETLDPLQEHIAVTYDHFGAPDSLDDALDRLNVLVRGILAARQSLTLVFRHPQTGIPVCRPIDCPDDWDRCYRTLADLPAPLQGAPLRPRELKLPGSPGPVRRLTPEDVEVMPE